MSLKTENLSFHKFKLIPWRYRLCFIVILCISASSEVLLIFSQIFQSPKAIKILPDRFNLTMGSVNVNT